jgi:hypothetical protein
MLRTDEYLTNLSQELGMLRLDRRPEAGAPGRLRSVETVDDLLTAFAEIRNDVRTKPRRHSTRVGTPSRSRWSSRRRRRWRLSP